jgi:hypothetical protein
VQRTFRTTHHAVRLTSATVVAVAFAAALAAPSVAANARLRDDDKPELSLRASPSIAFSPAEIYFVVELKGGADDYEEYYCAGAEWHWGDGTKSESSADCDPYEPGRSTIERRFVARHRYTMEGSFRVRFRLMQKEDSVAGIGTTVIVR